MQHFASAVLSMSKFISYLKNSNFLILEDCIETVRNNLREKRISVT